MTANQDSGINKNVPAFRTGYLMSWEDIILDLDSTNMNITLLSRISGQLKVD